MTKGTINHRFAFGENWESFLVLLDEDRIRSAEISLSNHLGDLTNKRFLDVGSGSGLFSLAARNLGANVVSFDVDRSSVQCTEELRRRYYPDDPNWVVMQGSALDDSFVKSLGRFDVVYSWGVLHHTGNLWLALEKMSTLGKPGGALFISIYNDQGFASRQWLRVKRRYNMSGPVGRVVLLHGVGLYFRLKALPVPVLARCYNLLRHNLKLRGDTNSGGRKRRDRGMDRRHDLVDWVGGYPFEVAAPHDVFAFYLERGFNLTGLKTCGGNLSCNEYVFTYPT